MLDSEQYFRAFPDERPRTNNAPSSPELIAALAALQREFQQFLARTQARATAAR